MCGSQNSATSEFLGALKSIFIEDFLVIWALSLLACTCLKNNPEKGVPYAEEMKTEIEKNSVFDKSFRINRLEILVFLYASTNRLNEACHLAEQLLQEALSLECVDEALVAECQYTLAIQIQ